MAYDNVDLNGVELKVRSNNDFEITSISFVGAMTYSAGKVVYHGDTLVCTFDRHPENSPMSPIRLVRVSDTVLQSSVFRFSIKETPEREYPIEFY